MIDEKVEKILQICCPNGISPKIYSKLPTAFSMVLDLIAVLKDNEEVLQCATTLGTTKFVSKTETREDPAPKQAPKQIEDMNLTPAQDVARELGVPAAQVEEPPQWLSKFPDNLTPKSCRCECELGGESKVNIEPPNQEVSKGEPSVGIVQEFSPKTGRKSLATIPKGHKAEMLTLRASGKSIQQISDIFKGAGYTYSAAQVRAVIAHSSRKKTSGWHRESAKIDQEPKVETEAKPEEKIEEPKHELTQIEITLSDDDPENQTLKGQLESKPYSPQWLDGKIWEMKNAGKKFKEISEYLHKQGISYSPESCQKRYERSRERLGESFRESIITA